MKKSMISIFVFIMLTIVFLYGITVSSEGISGGGGGSRPSGGGIVVIPDKVLDYAFTADISEANNVLYMDFDVPTGTSGKYMIVNAYKNSSVVGRKILPVNFTDKLVLMGCTDKPASLKINVWDSLANIKPIADYTEFDSINENGVQTFEPIKDFPTRYPVSNSIIKGQIAFVTAIGEYQSMGETEYEIEILNSDNTVVVYTFADTVNVKENESIKEIEDGILVDGTEKVEKALVAEYIENLVNAEKTTENFAKRVISYKANASGKITEISFSSKGKNTGLSYIAATTVQEYNAETKMLGEYSLTDATIVFHTPKNKSRYDYKTGDRATLSSGVKYNVAYLNIDEENNVGIVIITSNLLDSSSLAIVTASRDTVDEEGNDVVSVTFLQNGEEKTLIVDPESAKTSSLTTADFTRGVVFEYGVNARDYINDIIFVAEFNDKTLTGDVKVAAGLNRVPNSDYCYVAGWVVSKSGSTIGLAASATAKAANLISIDGVTSVYSIDATASKIKPVLSSIGDITKTIQLKDKDGNITGVDSVDGDYITSYILMKYVEKTIVDIVVNNGMNP